MPNISSTERNLITCIKNLAEANEQLFDKIQELRSDLDTERALIPQFNRTAEALRRIAAGNLDARDQTQIALEALTHR